MTFSAIVPNYNDAASLGQALASLAGQTRPFDEILVVDDGSTDDSLEVLGRLLPGMAGARLLREGCNQGVVAALNRGLREATGGFVILCSANDRYHLQLVERCAAMLERHPHLCALTGNAAIWDDARNRRGPASCRCLKSRQPWGRVMAACRRVPALLTPDLRFAAIARCSLAAWIRPPVAHDWFRSPSWHSPGLRGSPGGVLDGQARRAGQILRRHVRLVTRRLVIRASCALRRFRGGACFARRATAVLRHP